MRLFGLTGGLMGNVKEYWGWVIDGGRVQHRFMNKAEVELYWFNSASPRFVIYPNRGQAKKALRALGAAR
jgi:hypothetical protein